MEIDESLPVSNKKRAAQKLKVNNPKSKKSAISQNDVTHTQSTKKDTLVRNTDAKSKSINSPSSISYTKTDIGPFKVMVTYNINKEEDAVSKSPLDVEVSRSLIKLGVKFALLERVSRFKWIAIFDSRDSANMEGGN